MGREGSGRDGVGGSDVTLIGVGDISVGAVDMVPVRLPLCRPSRLPTPSPITHTPWEYGKGK